MRSDVVIDGDPRNPDVFNWDPGNFEHRILSEAGILKCFDACDAAWMHDGNPESPHAELTSGKCSNGFFDCMRVLCHSNLNEILARQLVRKLKAENLIDKVDWVIGSPYAAITFSYEVAKALGAVHGFAEKDPIVIPTDPKRKKMLWQRMGIPKDAAILQIEELITTSGTFKEVRLAVEKGNPEPVNFLPVIGTLVHRPPKLPADYGDIKVISLIEKTIWAVEPKDCPLCKQGSKPLRPKTHWAELTEKA